MIRKILTLQCLTTKMVAGRRHSCHRRIHRDGRHAFWADE